MRGERRGNLGEPTPAPTEPLEVVEGNDRPAFAGSELVRANPDPIDLLSDARIAGL